MKLLLHTCCAPCIIYPLEKLKERKFEVTAFFYNPNIHPLDEYQNRRNALVDFSSSTDIDILYPEYIPFEFERAVELTKDRPARCSICWVLRLKRTAQEARERRFSHFSTTLLVSPYQDQAELKRIGSKVAQEEGIAFYDEDFRTGFRNAHKLARAQGLYCQNYCGCAYSMQER